MAAKNQQDAKQDNKRKLTAGAKTEIKSSASKKQKLISSKPSKNNQSKEFKKPFNPIKGKQSLTKPKFEKSVANEGKMQPPTKRERRLHAKELAEARKKKRKRHYDLEQELASLWEKMRRRNIAKEDRSKLVSEAIRKMKGKIPEIAGSHVSSRVLQTCVKYCSQDDRDTVFEELQPHFLTLADNTYAVHLVKKMLDNASKKQLVGFISALHGHVGALLRHMVGSVVVEHAYQLGNATQKQEILIELYSTELQLFKDLVSTKQSRLVDVISKLGLQKGSVLRHMTSVIQPILEKGIVDHSIIHKLLIEYFSIADKTSAADVIQQLSGPLLVRMIHTKDGSRIGMLCVKHGSAKERKKIIKGMKGHIGKITHDQYGCLVLLCIVTLVDDTKLVKKIVIREVQPILKELVMDKSGRRVLLQLLHPNCSRYLSPDDLASLNSSIPSLCSKDEPVKTEEPNNEKADLEEEEVKADESTNPGENLQSIEGGKKDPQVRRQELLVGSGLAESVIDICIENTGELLRSNFGKEVVYEVARGGSDDILRPSFDDKLNTLHEAIASLAAESKSEESQEEHILENFHSSRSLRKLVIDCPTFASTLWENALAGKCELWAQGHGSKVVSAYLESSNSTVRELAKEELQPLVDRGMLKIPDRNQKAESNAKMRAETP